MTRPSLTRALLLAALPVLAQAAAPDAAPAQAADQAKVEKGDAAGSIAIRVRVPLADDRFAQVPLATVDDEVVTVDDLREVAAATHASRAEGKAARMDFAGLLDRLVTVRLLTAEARSMGIDDLEEVKRALDANRQAARTEALRRRAVAGVKADPAAVERRYREVAVEWKLRSVLFQKQEDATRFGAALAGGADFDALATRAAADKVGRADGGAQWLKTTELQPEVVAKLAALKPGEASAPFATGKGFTVVRLDERRQGDDPALRAQVESALKGEAVARALADYYAGLKRKHVTVDQAVLKSVDFDAPRPGFPALQSDARVVARIKGQKPITLGDVATEVIRPLFHGVESAQKEKRLDKDKAEALDSLISRRLVVVEAARLKVDEQPEVKRQLAQFETNLLFSSFIDRVILPELEVPDEALKAAYEARKKEFSFPAFYALEALVFADAGRAQAALKSLQSGTDSKWLKVNADGQVAPAAGAPLLDGSTVSATKMPEELRKALAGAKAGDFRIHEQGGQHFVISVKAVTPERTRSFEEAVDDVRPQVLNKALQQKIDEWVAKLRPAHGVKVFMLGGE